MCVAFTIPSPIPIVHLFMFQSPIAPSDTHTPFTPLPLPLPFTFPSSSHPPWRKASLAVKREKKYIFNFSIPIFFFSRWQKQALPILACYIQTRQFPPPPLPLFSCQHGRNTPMFQPSRWLRAGVWSLQSQNGRGLLLCQGRYVSAYRALQDPGGRYVPGRVHGQELQEFLCLSEVLRW